jgi:hypothetical protein
MNAPEARGSGTEDLTPLVRQLASQLRASRSGSAVAKSFPERETSPHADLRPTLDAIARAADIARANQDAVSVLRQRLDDAETRLGDQAQLLAESESRLRTALDEGRRERARGDELERRSGDLLAKTQELLTEASERLAMSESRAARAEADLTYLKDFVQERLGR